MYSLYSVHQKQKQPCFNDYEFPANTLNIFEYFLYTYFLRAFICIGAQIWYVQISVYIYTNVSDWVVYHILLTFVWH